MSETPTPARKFPTPPPPRRERGGALMALVLEAVEAADEVVGQLEEAHGQHLAVDDIVGNYTDVEAGTDFTIPLWDQGSWGQINYGAVRDLLASGDAKAVDISAVNNAAGEGWYSDDPAITFSGAHCGTSFCMAGTACMLAGDELVVGVSEDYIATHTGNEAASRGMISIDNVIVTLDDGTRVMRRVSDRARELLGLTWDDGDLLFAGENTIDEVRELASQIIEHGAIVNDGLDDDDEDYALDEDRN